MRYKYDKDGNLQIAWRSLKNANWTNPKSFIDEHVKKYYNDAIKIAHTIHTPLLTDADKESYALEGLLEAAGTYNPSYVSKRTNRTASFTTYLMIRIRHIILREVQLAKMQKRCASVVSLETGDRTFLRDVPNSATNDFWDEDSLTAFDTYVEPQSNPPFDLQDVVQKLKESSSKLTDTQLKILDFFLAEDTNGAKIARKLGITRQMVNLHLKQIRKQMKDILKTEAPFLKIGE